MRRVEVKIATLFLLHPTPTDSRNTGAYVARPRPGYYNITNLKRMRCTSSFRGFVLADHVFCFLCLFSSLLIVVKLSEMTEETSTKVSTFDFDFDSLSLLFFEAVKA